MNGLAGVLTRGAREMGNAARTMVLMPMLTLLIRLSGGFRYMYPFMRRILVTPGSILMLMLRIRAA